MTRPTGRRSATVGSGSPLADQRRCSAVDRRRAAGHRYEQTVGNGDGTKGTPGSWSNFEPNKDQGTFEGPRPTRRTRAGRGARPQTERWSAAGRPTGPLPARRRQRFLVLPCAGHAGHAGVRSVSSTAGTCTRPTSRPLVGATTTDHRRGARPDRVRLDRANRPRSRPRSPTEEPAEEPAEEPTAESPVRSVTEQSPVRSVTAASPADSAPASSPAVHKRHAARNASAATAAVPTSIDAGL